MKKLITLITFVVCISACNNSDRSDSGKAENDVDAARYFIQAALEGKFDKARKYLYPDSTNLQFMGTSERIYETQTPEEKKAYREASINIYAVTPLNDSSTLVVFSNSYRNQRDTLKVIKQNDEWLVDFKYLFLHGADSSGVKMITTDTLP